MPSNLLLICGRCGPIYFEFMRENLILKSVFCLQVFLMIQSLLLMQHIYSKPEKNPDYLAKSTFIQMAFSSLQNRDQCFSSLTTLATSLLTKPML